MKHSVLMALVMGVSIVFLGCSKDYVEPDQGMEDQATPFHKAAKVKRTFTGICTPVEMTPDINKWYDDADDWRVSGHTIWVQPNPDVFAGTATLIVDPKNPHDENRGMWEMTWSGTVTPNGAGLLIEAMAVGTGVEGKVKGLKANWTYSMDYDGTPETFFYEIQGNINAPQGPRKKD